MAALNKHVGLSQSALSQHLAVLRHAELVSTRRASQSIYYALRGTLAMDILKGALAPQGQARENRAMAYDAIGSTEPGPHADSQQE